MNLLCCYYLFLRRRPHLEAVTSRLFSSFCTCLCLGIGWEVPEWGWRFWTPSSSVFLSWLMISSSSNTCGLTRSLFVCLSSGAGTSRIVVSATKTKVASPSPSLVWRFLNLESSLDEEVEHLSNFKYPGFLQPSCTGGTSSILSASS